MNLSICCILPGCNRTIYSRGLCGSHYYYAIKRIKAKETTWEKLEALGESLPSQLKQAKSKFNYQLRRKGTS